MTLKSVVAVAAAALTIGALAASGGAFAQGGGGGNSHHDMHGSGNSPSPKPISTKSFQSGTEHHDEHKKYDRETKHKKRHGVGDDTDVDSGCSSWVKKHGVYVCDDDE
jgi:hypothetical protein